MQDTLSIIKPDGVRKKIVGKILKRFEDNGFEIINPRYINLSKEEAIKVNELAKKIYVSRQNAEIFEK